MFSEKARCLGANADWLALLVVSCGMLACSERIIVGTEPAGTPAEELSSATEPSRPDAGSEGAPQPPAGGDEPDSDGDDDEESDGDSPEGDSPDDDSPDNDPDDDVPFDDD